MNARDETGELSAATSVIVNSMSGILKDLDQVLGKIANGNLMAEIEAGELYVGDFASLVDSVKGIIAKLSDTMLQITTSAEQVSSGAEQVSDGARP